MSAACLQCRSPLEENQVGGVCANCLINVVAHPTSLASEESPLSPGSDFHGLEIVELLGRGGMGFVYKARQTNLNRHVALKILPQALASDPEFRERFSREAKTLAALSHPNIVAIHDFEIDGEYVYLVLEFIDGVNLRQIGRTLSPKQALEIVPQICDALEYAHGEGVVHRDIKPENILIDRKGRVKIADFGIAKIVGGMIPRPATITHTNLAMGTPHYMAPEQLENPKEVDHRADIYSLGVVFYEMLTGELPLGRFSPPSRKVQIDVRVDEVVLKALEKSPEQRYQRAGQVKEDVTRISVAPRPTSFERKVRGREMVVCSQAGLSWLMIVLYLEKGNFLLILSAGLMGLGATILYRTWREHWRTFEGDAGRNRMLANFSWVFAALNLWVFILVLSSKNREPLVWTIATPFCNFMGATMIAATFLEARRMGLKLSRPIRMWVSAIMLVIPTACTVGAPPTTHRTSPEFRESVSRESEAVKWLREWDNDIKEYEEQGRCESAVELMETFPSHLRCTEVWKELERRRDKCLRLLGRGPRSAEPSIDAMVFKRSDVPPGYAWGRGLDPAILDRSEEIDRLLAAFLRIDNKRDDLLLPLTSHDVRSVSRAYVTREDPRDGPGMFFIVLEFKEAAVRQRLALKLRGSGGWQGAIRQELFESEHFLAAGFLYEAEATSGFETLVQLLRNRIYPPARVTFAFKEVEIGSFVDWIARLSKANIVVAPDVVGTVTMSVDDIPWPDALEGAVRAVGGVMERDPSGIIRISRAPEGSSK